MKSRTTVYLPVFLPICLAAGLAICLAACGTPVVKQDPPPQQALQPESKGLLVIAYQSNEAGAIEPCG